MFALVKLVNNSQSDTVDSITADLARHGRVTKRNVIALYPKAKAHALVARQNFDAVLDAGGALQVDLSTGEILGRVFIKI